MQVQVKGEIEDFAVKKEPEGSNTGENDSEKQNSGVQAIQNNLEKEPETLETEQNDVEKDLDKKETVISQKNAEE